MNNLERPEYLDELIYVSCFKESKYIDEITKFIYEPIYKDKWKDHKPTISTKCTELKNKGWLLIDKQANKKLENELLESSKKTKEKIDKRQISLRKYHKTSNKPIMSRLKISENKDKKAIKEILSSEEFKKTFRTHKTVKYIDDIISILGIFILVSKYTDNLDKYSMEIVNKTANVVYQNQPSSKQLSQEEIKNGILVTMMINDKISETGKQDILSHFPYINLTKIIADGIITDINARKVLYEQKIKKLKENLKK